LPRLHSSDGDLSIPKGVPVFAKLREGGRAAENRPWNEKPRKGGENTLFSKSLRQKEGVLKKLGGGLYTRGRAQTKKKATLKKGAEHQGGKEKKGKRWGSV